MFLRVGLAALCAFPNLAFSTPDAGLPPPPAGFDVLQNGIPHGAVTASRSYPTRNYGNRLFTIYLPPGYSTATRYPVLYLLHGIGGNEVSWIGQGSNEGTAQHVMDFLYSRSLAQPMIVVMPNGKMDGANDTERFANFEDVLLRDLIPFLQANYSASTDPNLRGLAGLSMGGGQTLNFGFKNYTVFTWIGAFSSAPNTIAASTTITNSAAVRNSVHFSFFSCGTADGLIANTNNYHNFFDQNNINPHMYQLEQGQGHTKLVWNRSLYNFAQRIFTGATGLNPGIRMAMRGEAPRAGLVLQSGRITIDGANLAGLFNLAGRKQPLTAPLPATNGR